MGSESSARYIHMVQHLIEECILFNMSMEECMAALSQHANIEPVITSTVWKELEKENREFFEGYAKRREEEGRAEEASKTSSSRGTSSRRIPSVLLDSSEKEANNK